LRVGCVIYSRIGAKRQTSALIDQGNEQLISSAQQTVNNGIEWWDEGVKAAETQEVSDRGLSMSGWNEEEVREGAGGIRQKARGSGRYLISILT
jgi:hypothetical protein